jgi:hypothetical protein
MTVSNDFICVIVVLVLEGLLGLGLLYRSGVLKSRLSRVVCVLLLALALGLRALLFDYETLDYLNFLSRWVEFFREHGGFSALRYPIGNYNIPYLYFLVPQFFFPVPPASSSLRHQQSAPPIFYAGC